MHYVTLHAFVKKLARIGLHRFLLCVAAMGAGEDGFKNEGIHFCKHTAQPRKWRCN